MYNTILYGIKNGVSNFGGDVTFIVLFAVLSLLAIFVAVWLINLSIKKKPEKLTAGQLFGIMLIVAFVGLGVRILLSFLIRGNRQEYDEIAGSTGIVWKIITEGFSGYYSGDGDIYPFTLYLYSLFATLGSWFGMTDASVAAPFLIKLPLILADMGCVIMLYKIAKKYFNHVAAIAIAGLYALCPAFMLPSAVWGSLYSLLAFFMLLTFYFLVQKKYWQVFVVFSLALLTAKEAAYLFPVVAVFVVYQYVRAIKLHKKERKQEPLSFSQLIKSPERGLIIRIPIYFVACLIVMYVISLPFIIEDYSANFFIWLNEFYLKGLAKIDYYGYNALSLYNLFGMNGSYFSSRLAPLFVVLFLLIIVALTLVYYLSKKNRANLVMLAAFVLLTLSIFFIDFKEMTAFPILVLLMLSFILIKDKRLLQVLAVYAILMVINASVVMAYGGFLNNLGEAAFATEVGNSLLTSTTGKVVNIICSSLAVVTYLYLTFIIMDITMNNNRKLFLGQDTKSPLYAVKHWIIK